MRRALPVTPAEFEILEILWEEPSPVPVSRVLEVLKQQKDVAYTTVMTLLDTMARKGTVRRKKRGKAWFYRPAANRERVLGTVVEDFARCYFGGKQKLGRFLGARPRRVVKRKKRPPKPAAEAEDDMDVVLL